MWGSARPPPDAPYGRGYPPNSGGFPAVPPGSGGFPPYGGHQPPPYGGQPPATYAGPYSAPAPQYGGQPYGSGGHPSGGYPSSGYPSAPAPHIHPPPSQFQGWYSGYYSQNSNNELAELQRWFRSMDRDGNGRIAGNELANVAVGGIVLGIEVALKLIRIFDVDGNGEIDFYEYASLHKFLLSMQTVFAQADADRSGKLDPREIHTALRNGGFNINFNVVNNLFRKFDTSGTGMDMKQFISLVAHVAQTKSAFERLDTDKDGRITLDFDQLLNVTSSL